MQIDKKTVGTLFIGLIIGILSVFIIRKVIDPLIDTKSRSDYTAMNYLKKKIIAYKNSCNHYPDQKDGLNVLLEKDSGTCFPPTERMNEIPKNSNDESYIYFVKEGEFFIVNPLDKEMIVSSKNTFL